MAIIDRSERRVSEYEALTTGPVLFKTSPASCLAVEGQGPPGGEEFHGKLDAVMATAYAVEAACRTQGQGFAVSRLEALWWTDEVEGIGFAARPRSEWKWKLLVKVPDFVSAGQVAAAAAQIAREQAAAREIALETLVEGRCVQILHIGPYRDIPRAMEAIRRFVDERGLEIAGRHHEICLTDPRHTAPEEMRTIVRYPVR